MRVSIKDFDFLSRGRYVFLEGGSNLRQICRGGKLYGYTVVLNDPDDHKSFRDTCLRWAEDNAARRERAKVLVTD